jgi:hypothetical protein
MRQILLANSEYVLSSFERFASPGTQPAPASPGISQEGTWKPMTVIPAPDNQEMRISWSTNAHLFGQRCASLGQQMRISRARNAHHFLTYTQGTTRLRPGRTGSPAVYA